MSWMSNIDDDKSVSDINMPGTHDSTAYSFPGKDKITTQLAKTQYRDGSGGRIIGQLNKGARFLDIRVDLSWRCCHGKIHTADSIFSVMDVVTNFLTDNPKEVILMRIKDDCDKKKKGDSPHELYQNVKDKYGSFIYHVGKRTTMPKLKDCRKKIILFDQVRFLSGGALMHHDGIAYKWGDENIMNIQDNYSHVEVDSKVRDVMNFSAAQQNTRGKFVFNFVNAVDLPNTNPQNFDVGIAPAVITQMKAKPAGWRTHILVWDFFNSEKFDISTKNN